MCAPCVCRMYAMCLTCVFHAYAMCISYACGHVYSMCVPCVCHRHAMCMPCVGMPCVFHVYAICVPCVFHVCAMRNPCGHMYSMCMPCVRQTIEPNSSSDCVCNDDVCDVRRYLTHTRMNLHTTHASQSTHTHTSHRCILTRLPKPSKHSNTRVIQQLTPHNVQTQPCTL